jgi:hypothetical protein
MMKFVRTLGIAVAAGTALTILGCGDGDTPTGPGQPGGSVTISAPAIKAPMAGTQLDTLRPTLEVTNAVTTGTPGTIMYRFEASEMDSFPPGSRTFTAESVAQGSGSTSVVVGPSDLIPAHTYFWRVRATNGTVTSDWSKVETFKTKLVGFKNGQTVFDPLTDGQSVGVVHGGTFVPGEGWRSNNLTDGIDYDIPTCTACRVEFDVTNFGKAEGAPFEKDIKWLSMGDATSFNNFDHFRNHPWKMHLEQRGDGDGTGMKLIWRNGDAGDGDPGDHTGRNDSTVNWNNNQVFHFVVEWHPDRLSVSVDGREWFEDGFARPYAPPNHRVHIGCRPRGESMISAIYRNIRITPL